MIEQGADIAAVNNDGELAVDIAESDEMEDLLNKVLKEKGQYSFILFVIFVIREYNTNVWCGKAFRDLQLLDEIEWQKITYRLFQI